MNKIDSNKTICGLVTELGKQDLAGYPKSRPGKFNPSVSQDNTGETAYQRSLFTSISIAVSNPEVEITWLDMELPVVFGVSPRRPSLDLLGRDQNDRLVFCELKYDKPSSVLKPNTKPRTNSPVFALREVLTNHNHVKNNCRQLQDENIYHDNRKETWDWTDCENPNKILLLVVANHTYWKRWREYEPKSGIDAWSTQMREISNILSALPAGLEVKFFEAPDEPFYQQTVTLNDEKRYIPNPAKGKWVEVNMKD